VNKIDEIRKQSDSLSLRQGCVLFGNVKPVHNLLKYGLSKVGKSKIYTLCLKKTGSPLHFRLTQSDSDGENLIVLRLSVSLGTSV